MDGQTHAVRPCEHRQPVTAFLQPRCHARSPRESTVHRRGRRRPLRRPASPAHKGRAQSERVPYSRHCPGVHVLLLTVTPQDTCSEGNTLTTFSDTR